jgi:Secretion system C-terminal sorting domain
MSSQNIADFQATFYFEDSQGNKDSCILGYDSHASSDSLEESFGEYELVNPFDSVLDVRLTYFTGNSILSQYHLFSKKYISAKEENYITNNGVTDTCYYGSSLIFFIKTKYPPVKILWSRDLFRNNDNICLGASHFRPSRLWEWLFPPYNDSRPEIACLGVDSTFLFDPNLLPSNYELRHLVEFPSEGNPYDTIYGINFGYGISYFETPAVCIDSVLALLVSAEQPNLIEVQKKNSLNLNPNPVHTTLMVSTKDKYDFELFKLYNMGGQLLYEEDLKNKKKLPISIYVGNLDPGIYVLRLLDKHGQYFSKRFVKVP